MSATVTDAPDSNPFSVLGDALEAAAESIGDASSDASEQAKIAARKVKSGVASGAYHAAYGVSFGVVFGAVFLKELLPEQNVIRRGFEDGAEAAIDAVAARRAPKHETHPYEADDTDSDLVADEPAPAPAARAPRARKVVIRKKTAG